MRHGRVDNILDTNVLISFLIGKSLARLNENIVSGRVRLIVCDELIHELVQVSSRPKLSKLINPVAVSEFVELLAIIARNVKVRHEINLCRDPKDNFLLDLALQSKADFLVTGD